MNRRKFTKDSLWMLTGILLLDTISANKLYAAKYDSNMNKWLKSVAEICADLKKSVLSETEWQNKIAELHNTIGDEDISKLIDFNKVQQQLRLPDKGVDAKRTILPKIEGYSERFTFTGKIFGMKKDCAIIPHGHKNMVSCHRVIKGNLWLRQYDRLNDDKDFMYIRQTIDELVKPGTHSSISDERNNVHWLIAKDGPAYTFDVIVSELNNQHYEIHNLDIDSAIKEKDDLLRVKKIDVTTALGKYGFDTHH